MPKFGVGVNRKQKNICREHQIFEKLHFLITLLVKDHACDILIIFSKALQVRSDERFQGKTYTQVTAA